MPCAVHPVVTPLIPPDALRHLPALRWVKEKPRKTGIFLDLDGTLCALVDDPAQVQLPRETRAYVEGLSSLYRSVVIISGRAASALATIVDLPGVEYVGNHGLEIRRDGQREVLLPSPDAERMRAVGEALTEGVVCEGTFLELKELSHAIHYRRASDPEATRTCILQALRALELSGIRLTEGKRLVQVRPDVALDKGTALELLVKRGRLRSILYAGDDTTDLDAFRAVSKARDRGSLRAVLIAVHHDDTPAALLAQADYAVEGTAGMQRFLEWLSVSF